MLHFFLTLEFFSPLNAYISYTRRKLSPLKNRWNHIWKGRNEFERRNGNIKLLCETPTKTRASVETNVWSSWIKMKTLKNVLNLEYKPLRSLSIEAKTLIFTANFVSL